MKNISCYPFDCLVIGSGFAGAVMARELAERAGKKVLIVEKRDHIGGNAYDRLNDDGILIHQYGPHIFHTNTKRVYDYLSRFTRWREYQHEVVGNIHGKLMPIPFNLNSLRVAFDADKADRLQSKLIAAYGMGSKVTIHELRNGTDAELAELADFVYENVFLHYTRKQWGQTPEEIDPAVTARVPIYISYDNRYFQDTYQGMPLDGYTPLFSAMLTYPNISLMLSTHSSSIMTFGTEGIVINGEPFGGEVIYTGPADELFDCQFGRLPYRTLDFAFETHPLHWYQSRGTINYPVSEDYTRITEFKHLTGQKNDRKTTITKEFARDYTASPCETPYYAVSNPQNLALYERYRTMAAQTPRLHLLGRLAEYQYYNMDMIIERALLLADMLVK